MISPFLKTKPSPLPPAMPTSASRASPGPLTTQPITATVIGSLILAKCCSTVRATFSKSIEVRPQVGQEIKVGPYFLRPKALRIW